MTARTFGWLAATLLVGASGAIAQDVITAEFELIPTALGANDMTPDGRYVVGESDSNGDGLPDGSYRWDSVTNTVIDLNLTGDPTTTVPVVAVSDDGSIVLGNMPDPNDPNDAIGNVAGIWRESTGTWESLGYLPNAQQCPSRSTGYELSSDGGVAVGLSWDGCSARAIRWTQATGMVEMEPLANASCRASVVAADGTLSAGFCQGSFSRTPAFWDADGNGQLLDPPNGDALGEIHGMNDAGTIMLGEWLDPNSLGSAQATMWTPGTGPGGWDRATIGAGSLLPGWSGIPTDIDDCGVIVGFDFLLGNRRAWIIDDDGNYQLLKDFVTSHGGTVPAGFPMEVAQAITTDGRYIVGHGFGTGAWRVTITRTPLCPGDASRDGQVDLSDLALLLADFGNTGCRLPADVNGDGTIDLSDLAIVLANFGNSCT